MVSYFTSVKLSFNCRPDLWGLIVEKAANPSITCDMIQFHITTEILPSTWKMEKVLISEGFLTFFSCFHFHSGFSFLSVFVLSAFSFTSSASWGWGEGTTTMFPLMSAFCCSNRMVQLKRKWTKRCHSSLNRISLRLAGGVFTREPAGAT